MSYRYSRSKQYSKPETIGGESAKTMLDHTLAQGGLTPWERNFVDSLSEGWKKYGSLTTGQHQTLQKVAARYSDENIKKRESWEDQWDDSKQESFQIMAHYYKANPPYFGDLAERALTDFDYIPTERAFSAMCENKYAQKVIGTYKSDPLYDAGTMVTVRNSQQVQRSIRGKTVFVISHPKEVISAANGAKPVMVLPVGEGTPIQTEERWLKKLPKRLR